MSYELVFDRFCACVTYESLRPMRMHEACSTSMYCHFHFVGRTPRVWISGLDSPAEIWISYGSGTSFLRSFLFQNASVNSIWSFPPLTSYHHSSHYHPHRLGTRAFYIHITRYYYRFRFLLLFMCSKRCGKGEEIAQI